jgi:hypothetical protein
MKPCARVFVLFTVILAVSPGAQGQTASELIEHAHKYDNMYVSSSDASQQKALEFYQAALRAGPDDKQQLHILYRMAQLHGAAYQLEKGEKPDFRKAIQLYEQIIHSYPPEEPLVFKAKISVGDHYTTLWEFETALKWFKKALEYDTSELQEQIKAIEQRSRELEQREQARRESELRPGERTSDPMTREERLEFRSQRKRPRALEKTLECIKRYQQIAVDQVAYCGNLIDPLRAHGELRVIIAQHSGTFIAERARQRLEENMDRRPELWAPTDHLPGPSNSSLQSGGSVAVRISESPKSMKTDSDVVPHSAERHYSLEPNTSEQAGKDKYAAKQTRGPPSSYLSVSVIGAAGLIVFGLAVVMIRRRTSS